MTERKKHEVLRLVINGRCNCGCVCSIFQVLNSHVTIVDIVVMNIYRGVMFRPLTHWETTLDSISVAGGRGREGGSQLSGVMAQAFPHSPCRPCQSDKIHGNLSSPDPPWNTGQQYDPSYSTKGEPEAAIEYI